MAQFQASVYSLEEDHTFPFQGVSNGSTALSVDLLYLSATIPLLFIDIPVACGCAIHSV